MDQEIKNKKILDAIADCDRYIAKEGSRLQELRSAEIQKLLEWYRAHRLKLIGMLA